MKTWVSTLLVVVVGYAAYRQWFAADDPEDPAPPPLEVSQPEQPPAPTGSEVETRPHVALDGIGAAATDSADEGPVAQLAAEWRGALARSDAEAARTVADRILSEWGMEQEGPSSGVINIPLSFLKEG